jgi:hypothetical protein
MQLALFTVLAGMFLMALAAVIGSLHLLWLHHDDDDDDHSSNEGEEKMSVGDASVDAIAAAARDEKAGIVFCTVV